MNLNLLQKDVTVQTDPYPHIVIENALPEDVYAELERTFPDNDVLSTEALDEGICYRWKADKLLQEAYKPQIWREFCAYHTSVEWFNSVLEVFKDHIPPQLNYNNQPHHVGARGWADDSVTFWTDCQLVMHKPITERTSRTPHLDNPMEIFAGLLYMPHPDDTGTGGEFQLHKSQGDIKDVKKKLGRQVEDKNDGGVVKTVPYKPNTFAMFLNVKNAIHGVSLRQNPTQYRRSVNIIGEFKRGVGKMWNVREL